MVGTVVPQPKDVAKAAPPETPKRPPMAPMPPAQRLSVIWLREARKG